MAGYLIAVEGPLAEEGLIVKFEEGTEWVLGRNPDEVGIVLKDLWVSHKHVICRLTPEGYVLENLSSVNPATHNSKVIDEPVLLHENDIVQIGNTYFRFSLHLPQKEPSHESSSLIENAADLSSLSLSEPSDTRWLVKVISGPNTGAEFHLQPNKSYIIGKDPDPTQCDILFQDLSVSRQHARLTVEDEEHVFIEDLGSRNGTLVNNTLQTARCQLASNDLVALGTTSFLVIDQEQAHETLVSTPTSSSVKTPSTEEPKAPSEAVAKDWKEMVIPKRHLVLVGVFGCILLVSLVGVVSLFQSEPIVLADKHEGKQIEELLKKYPDVQSSYNEGSGKLFLTGHVLTAIEKQELTYQLQGLPFLQNVEDTIVIDEYVWENMNALLITNSAWQGIAISAPSPGHFVLRGYLQTAEQAQDLSDYINVNFPYLDRLDNQVVVEGNLMTEIESQLLEKGYNNVTYQLSNGELVLSGRVDGRDQANFITLMNHFKALRGIRSVKNFVIFTNEDSSLVDLSSKYKVLGFSRKDGETSNVVINGKILGIGEILDGMTVTEITPNMIVLEKDGLKFKINYNLQ